MICEKTRKKRRKDLCTMATHTEVYVFFGLFVLVAFLILVGGSRSIFQNYYAQVQAATPPTVIQPLQTAPPPPPAAPGAIPGGTNLSNPVSASLSQLVKISQTLDAATNIPSPSAGADIGTILTYLRARGGRLDGSAWSEEALRILKNRTPWVCGGMGSQMQCTYPAGIDTQQTWLIFFDDGSGKWNLRALS
jgi:hypothetical protein